MNTTIRYILVFLASIINVAGMAQEATVSNLRLGHNVMHNGEKSMKIHFTLVVDGLKGGKINAIAYFDSPKGTGIRDTNGRYCTSGGTVCASTAATPNYASSKWNDFTLYIPNDELHLYPGNHTYYCRVFIQNAGTGKFIGKSDFVSFTANNTNGGAAVNPSRQSSSNSRVRGGTPTFPNKQWIYLADAKRERCVSLYFNTDNNGDRTCSVNSRAFYVLEGTHGNSLFFKGYTNQPETKSVVGYNGIPRFQYTGRIIKARNDFYLYYYGPHRINLCGTEYNVPITAQQYRDMGSGGNGAVSGSAVAPAGGYGSSSSGSSSSNGNRPLKCGDCGGSGSCRMCSGSGYSSQWTSPSTHRGDINKCNWCHGSGKCPTCHGRGHR